MANVNRIVYAHEHFNSSACGFSFVDSVCVPKEPIDSNHFRVTRLRLLFPGTKIELGPFGEEKKAAPAKKEEKVREDVPAAIAHVRVDDLGGDIWAAIPVDVDGKARECLGADGGGLLMSHGDALALATEHAASLGVEVTGIIEKPKADVPLTGHKTDDANESGGVGPAEQRAEGDPIDKPDADDDAKMAAGTTPAGDTESPAADSEKPADDVDGAEPDTEEVAKAHEDVRTEIEAKGQLDNGADVAALAKAAAKDEAAKPADETAVVPAPKKSGKGGSKKKKGKNS